MTAQGLLGGLEVAVNEEDAGALAGEEDGGGFAGADAGAAGAGAGDDGDFILEAGTAGWEECHGNLRVVVRSRIFGIRRIIGIGYVSC